MATYHPRYNYWTVPNPSCRAFPRTCVRLQLRDECKKHPGSWAVRVDMEDPDHGRMSCQGLPMYKQGSGRFTGQMTRHTNSIVRSQKWIPEDFENISMWYRAWNTRDPETYRCKAREMDGQFAIKRHFGYRLTDADFLLLCAAAERRTAHMNYHVARYEKNKDPEILASNNRHARFLDWMEALWRHDTRLRSDIKLKTSIAKPCPACSAERAERDGALQERAGPATTQAWKSPEHVRLHCFPAGDCRDGAADGRNG